MQFKCAHCNSDIQVEDPSVSHACSECGEIHHFFFRMEMTLDELVNSVRRSGQDFTMRIEKTGDHVALTLHTEKMGFRQFLLNDKNMAISSRKLGN